MTKNKVLKEKLGGSIEHTSILRRFTVLFLLMSVIPLIVLYYFYVELRDLGGITLSADELNLTLTFIVLGIIIGYGSIRRILTNLVRISEVNRKALAGLLRPDQIPALSQEHDEIAVLSKSFEALTECLEENIKSLELARRNLHTIMSKIGHGISDIQNIDTFLNLILEALTEGLFGETGALMVLDKDKAQFSVKAVYGVEFQDDSVIPVESEAGAALYAIAQLHKPYATLQTPQGLTHVKGYERLFNAPMACAPLMTRGKILGVLVISGRKVQGDFQPEDLGLLANVAAQTAVSIENINLSQDAEKTYFETIVALALAVDAKDRYSRGHLDRVTDHCLLIARKLGLDENDIQTLRGAARLHDLGKIGIPDHVLQKRGPLNDQEWTLMRRHPEIGESIIKPIRSLSHLCEIIRHHHEKLDGSGYPDGLKDDAISPLAKIITVADIYDALTSDRPYRYKMSRREAFSRMREMKDTIDQDIVEALIEALEEKEESTPPQN
jgi:GAF domain-containing protein